MMGQYIIPGKQGHTKGRLAMKKFLVALFSMVFIFSFTGCGNSLAEESEKEEPKLQESTEDSTVEQTENVDTNSAEGSESGILIVYFSRWGNTEYPEDVDATTSASIVVDEEKYGTTEYIARMIQKNVGGDLHLIRTREPYPVDFDELRELNHNEMDEEYLPPLVESDLDILQYDIVFIGYPIWATDVPQAVLSFLDEYDLSGKTVIPFCTHDGYGEGSSYNTIREASHADELLEGLALNSADVPTAEMTVESWLDSNGI
ncbi:flavodoxin family protein [Marvinbryantia formatexigens DSM 14469]|uniref:Flavodoxin family protein n=1 Tax=Marvinbryantia formatexigens DSM 14469 TaxID=478749 RepID=C6LEA4_9FIRM|nr:flavodoxin [Marvinbryantia formatexigens]EET60887.1 flavodoxin family protein [Marvinbryantia formatexigens DSM 14469]UWO24809.1 hypothetical protein NQ534_20755 [Marvinbryantia formatexigens DSM 14469]SDF24281.1 Flavodoxin [Marvinbryantia formatexigens]